MSGHQYISNSSNLFTDDGDIDDETFLRNSRPKISQDAGYGSSNHHYSNTLSNLESQRQTIIERKQEIEQRTLDSTSRSLGILRDSEQIGIATAEELLKQREQLENSSKRLDEINTNLRFSQKHINGIKSVFSSLKNYISGKNEGRVAGSPSESRANDSPLSEAFGSGEPSRDLYNNHPSTRLRGLDEKSQQQSSAGELSGSKKMNELLEANLDEMVDNITRLKGLATHMGEEILSQTDLIDTIQGKVEQADETIGRQNKQMNKLLGKS